MLLGARAMGSVERRPQRNCPGTQRLQRGPSHSNLDTRNVPGQFNPALALSTFRTTSNDRPKVGPFTIEDAESIIAASHRLHGELRQL